MAGQNSIFDNEDKIISGIKAALEHSPALAADPSHLSLISAYERLLRTTKHLVKLNDSSAQRQTELAREAAEKKSSTGKLVDTAGQVPFPASLRNHIQWQPRSQLAEFAQKTHRFLFRPCRVYIDH